MFITNAKYGKTVVWETLQQLRECVSTLWTQEDIYDKLLN